MANDIGISINTYLLAQTSVAAICAQRGYPGHLPKGCLFPAFHYMLISDVESHHLGGVSGIREARLQIECTDDLCPGHVPTRRLVNQLDEANKALLDGQRGTFGGTFCHSILQENRFEDDVQPIGNDHWRYVTNRDYLIWYTA